MAEYKYGVFIGRFQPLHNAHHSVILQALEEVETLIILIGSAKSTQDIKNPFSFEERAEMIAASLGEKVTYTYGLSGLTCEHKKKQIYFVPIRDYFYNENMWIAEVQRCIGDITKGDPSVALYGSYKDSSSYYVNLFPQYDFRPASTKSGLNATDIRNALFEQPLVTTGWSDRKYSPWYMEVPSQVADWIKNKFLHAPDAGNGLSERYLSLKAEYQFIKDYKATWANTPHPVTFVTTDAVVIKSGHVLLIERKMEPGKGLKALPGGFLAKDKTIEDSMLKELKEETRIKVDKLELRRSIVDQRVFDYPGRDARGRTITHAYAIDLGSGELPEVRGADDAKKALWVPLIDAIQNEKSFYSDHWHIIYYFMMQHRRVK